MDDDDRTRELLSQLLTRRGHAVRTAATGEAALTALRAGPADACLLDIDLPDRSGLDVLEEIVAEGLARATIMLTALSDLEVAVDAMRRGAADFIRKPVDLQAIEAALVRVTRLTALEDQVEALAAHPGRPAPDIIGQSAALQAALRVIQRAARTESTVLITGESGTGKELAARFLHRASLRAARPFIAVSAANLEGPLLASQLFGHEVGAFTGAQGTRRGLLAAAEGGTLFLDEIGELDADLQAKLLRFLETRVYRPVGSDEERSADVRLVAATHRDLEAATREGGFRADLYYRIAVVPVHLPPVRERPEDIPILVDHFVRRLAQKLGREAPRVAPEAISALTGYRFPGNVRELRNLVERALIVADGPVLGVRDLVPASALRARPGAPVADTVVGLASGPVPSEPAYQAADEPFSRARKRAIAAFERAYVEQILTRTAGNVSQACREAGLDRGTFYRLARRHAIDPSSFR